MLGPPSTNLAEYAISVTHGFLPDEPPLQALTDDYYLPWELVIGQLPQLLESNILRTTVDRLPVLSTSHLKTESNWRRAYLVLSFLTHGYIWEAGGPSEVTVLIQITPRLMLMISSVCHLVSQYPFCK
jgi:indoleamine 2,3-dioxygenase